jgi:hypothetical protein
VTVDVHARLSPTMVLLLALIDASTRRENGQVVRWWVPRTFPDRVMLPDGEEVEYQVWGASDANALRALERRGLTQKGPRAGYGATIVEYAATEAGHAWIERERARHASRRGA